MPVTSVAMLASQAQALDGLLPCQRENPQLWFSGLPADLELARAHCRPCPRCADRAWPERSNAANPTGSGAARSSNEA